MGNSFVIAQVGGVWRLVTTKTENGEVIGIVECNKGIRPILKQLLEEVAPDLTLVKKRVKIETKERESDKRLRAQLNDCSIKQLRHMLVSNGGGEYGKGRSTKERLVNSLLMEIKSSVIRKELNKGY